MTYFQRISAQSKRTKKALLVLVALTVPALAAPPTISNITQHGLYHSSINFEYQISVGALCQLKYGTTSGVYPYSAGVAPSADPLFTGVNTCALSLGGLAPNTTYYVLPTAWPWGDQNSTANVCQVSGCGAVQQSFTTLAEPAIHPEPPIAPTTWTPVEPNTAGYTVVNLKINGSGTCVANGSSGPGLHWASAVNDGDDLPAILGKIWYQTVIRVPQGADCLIRPTDGFNQGVYLPRYSVAPSATDWVVVETAPGGAADFPPFGSRIGPSFANHLGIMRMATPMMPSTGLQWGGITTWNMFGCAGAASPCGIHFWFRNLEVQGQNNTTIFPVGVMDPSMYGMPFSVAPACTSGINCNPDDATTSPDYIVLDRIYIPNQTYPYRQIGCFSPGGNHWLIIGTYCETDTWQPAVWPQMDAFVSGAVITIPYSYVRKPTNGDARVGMPRVAGYFGTATQNITIGNVGDHILFKTDTSLSFATGDLIQVTHVPASGNEVPEQIEREMVGVVSSYNSGTRDMDFVITSMRWPGYTFGNWEINRPNQVTFSGANLSTYTGQVNSWIDNSGVTVNYQTAAGITATCKYATGCNITNTATPYTTFGFDGAPATGFWLFSGTFNGAGTFAIQGGGTYFQFRWGNPSRWSPWRPLGLYVNSGRYGIYRNNYMQAIGQTIYADTVGKLTDIVLDHNYLYTPRSQMENNPAWDGTFRMSRNAIEFKECNRCLITGNIVDGTLSEENTGAPIYIAGSWTGTFSAGTTDWDVHSNIFRHISSGIQCTGGGSATPPDAVQAKRLRIYGNMFLDLNRDIYSNNFNKVYGPSFITGALSVSPGCADLEISGNTVGQARGYGPALLINGPSSDGPSVFGEGFKYFKNFSMTALGPPSLYDPIDTSSGGPYSTPPSSAQMTNFPAFPFIQVTRTGTWSSRMTTEFQRINAGNVFTPSWVTGLNIMIPGQINSVINPDPPVWSDIPQSGATGSVDYINTHWDLDTTSHIIQGNTQAARLAAAGWSGLDLSSGNPRKYRINASAAHAGDAGANVDQVLSDAGVVSDIKVTPGGTTLTFSYTAPDAAACSVDTSPNAITWTRVTDGGGARSRTVAATGLPSSTLHNYRIMCYYDQTAAMEFDPDQITSGTVTTLASATRTVLTGIGSLPATATQALVMLTPLSGSPVSATCSTSPCSIASVPVGTYTRTVQPQTSGAVAVGPPITADITIQ